MHFCVHCGARVEDPARPVCAHCGAPPAAAKPAGDDYLRVGRTLLPRWLPAALAAVLVVGGVTLGVAVANRPDRPSGLVYPELTYDGPEDTASPYESYPYGDATDDGSGTEETYPDDTYSSDDSGGYDDGTEETEDPETTDDASSVVTTYYDRINSGDYATAWDMGGSNLFSGSYEDWVAGFDTTAHVDVTATDEGYGAVGVDISATQTDGSVKEFTGTYTVENGEITGADIHEVT